MLTQPPEIPDDAVLSFGPLYLNIDLIHPITYVRKSRFIVNYIDNYYLCDWCGPKCDSSEDEGTDCPAQDL